jgi:hypothetical protein
LGAIILLGIPAVALILADLVYPFFHSWIYLEDIYFRFALRLGLLFLSVFSAAKYFHRFEPAKDKDGP